MTTFENLVDYLDSGGYFDTTKEAVSKLGISSTTFTRWSRKLYETHHEPYSRVTAIDSRGKTYYYDIHKRVKVYTRTYRPPSGEYKNNTVYQIILQLGVARAENPGLPLPDVGALANAFSRSRYKLYAEFRKVAKKHASPNGAPRFTFPFEKNWGGSRHH
ncbi:MAG: hypothetical protein NTW67_04330 [Candidatus Woesearchaeota archaeon]|nr:hypothetical protein [Candidatus Woesearchaeota archaeon]